MATIPTRQLDKDGPQVSAIDSGEMASCAFCETSASDEEHFKVQVIHFDEYMQFIQ
jgi:hypothetical protein